MQRRNLLGLGLGTLSVLTIGLAAVLLVVDSGDASPSDDEKRSERGLHLFVNKGCISCHNHERALAEVEGVRSLGRIGAYGTGPNLTDYDADPEFLREWLADPTSVRPDTRMPNLDLEDGEIEAIIAFLNGSEDEG